MEIKEIIRNIISNPQDFFLKNLGIRQIIFKNTFWLAVAEGVSRFLKLILIIYIARILGATEYGKFTFALAFVGLFVIFSDLGLSQITTREFAKNKEEEKEFSSLLSLKLLLGLGTLILIFLGSFFITLDPLIQKLIWILAVFAMVESFLTIFFSFFQARQKMEYQAWAKILEAAMVTGAGFYVLFYFPSVLNLGFGYLFSVIISLIFILLFFHFKVYRLRLEWNKFVWQKFLAMSWPLALVGIFGGIQSQTDSVMMGYFGQITQTGWYNAAYRIIGATFIPASLIGISFFPVLSKFFQESKEKLQKIWNYYLESMIFLATPILVGGMVLASKIIDFIYDPSYFPSILALQILLIMVGISFLASPFSQILIVANQQKKLFWSSLSGAIINVILNLILIPKYSLYGAAATTVVSFFLIFFLLYNFTLKFTPIKPFNLKLLFSFLGAGLSSILMYLVIIQPQIYQLHVFLSILIGAGVYLICFLVYKKLLVNSFFKVLKKCLMKLKKF